MQYYFDMLLYYTKDPRSVSGIEMDYKFYPWKH